MGFQNLGRLLATIFLFAASAAVPRSEATPLVDSPFGPDNVRSLQEEVPNSFPLCVGVSGNGQKLWAHFTAFAQIVESMNRPIDVLSGGSSGTLSMFITESIHSNPIVVNPDLTNDERVAYISFLLKSVEGSGSLLITQQEDILERVLLAVAAGGGEGADDLMTRLASDDPLVRAVAVSQLLFVFQRADQQLQSELNIMSPLVNPEVMQLLRNSGTPSEHAQDILQNSNFNFNTASQTMFIRPGILNFQALAEMVDIAASFYIGYEPVDMTEMEDILAQCAMQGLGKEWPEIALIVTDSGEACGTRFQNLTINYNLQQDPLASPNRLDETLGTESFYSIGQSALIARDSAARYQGGLSNYASGILNASWEADFADVDFGYWGNPVLLERAEQNLQNWTDSKSRRFRKLGQKSWNYVLMRSPAEPGLSRAIETGDGFLSVGGWADLTPGQLLESVGCETTILVQRRGGAGTFQTGVANLLGATLEDIQDMYNLSDPNSSWTQAIEIADGSICNDWNAYNDTDIRGIMYDGWSSPLVSMNETLLDIFSMMGEERVQLPGCTPLLSEGGTQSPSTVISPSPPKTEAPVSSPAGRTLSPTESPSLTPDSAAIPMDKNRYYFWSSVWMTMSTLFLCYL